MMTVELPRQTKRNGTLYAHVFLSKAQETHSGDKWTKLLTDPETVYTLVPMSIYKEPEYKIFQLLQDGENVKNNVKKPISHVKAILPLSMLIEPIHISQIHMPSDVYQYIRYYIYFFYSNLNCYHPILFLIIMYNNYFRLYKKSQEYLPIFLHNTLQDRSYNVTKIDKNTTFVPILLRYEPLSYAGLR